MKTALLIIDIQSYFLRRSPSDLPAKIIKHLSLSSYDVVAFTIFENKMGSNWEKSLHWIKSRTRDDLLLADEFRPFITEDNVYSKHTYSALKISKLKQLLESSAVERIEICGIDTDACVLATAYEAFDLGYEVKVLTELSYSRANLDSAVAAILEKNLQSKN